jgi:CO dehydrogenase maturation factor
VDDIFDIIDPSKKSFKHVERAYKIAKEIGVEFKNFYVVGGYRFPENLKSVVNNKKFKFLGKIPYDKDIEDYGLLGKSLLELSNTSPAYISIKKIMKKANY